MDHLNVVSAVQIAKSIITICILLYQNDGQKISISVRNGSW